MIQILKSVQYYDGNDDLYNEFGVTFEYQGKRFIAIHIVAYSGAWNRKLIGYEPKGFKRLYGGGAEIIDFDGTDFTEDELIEAAEILMESKEDELYFYDEDRIEDKKFQKMKKKPKIGNRRRLTPQKEEKMLRPAQLYREQLQRKNTEAWYRPENIFWNGGTGDAEIMLPDNNYERHCFVSVDKEDNVIGYISYNVDWSAMSAYGFGAISYDKGNLVFARDLNTAICNLFEVYHLNRCSWCCFADNPAIRGYRNFIKRHGGKECGYHRQVARLQDGKLHDDVEFEILACEFKKQKLETQKFSKK